MGEDAVIVTALPARTRPRRLAIAVSVMAVLVGFLAVRTYQHGGAHLAAGGGWEVGGPAATGVEFHTSVVLDTAGRDIRLLAARAVRVDPGLRVRIRLAQVPPGRGGVGAVQSPLPYPVAELAGRTVHGDRRNPAWLDVSGVATRAGVYRFEGIAVTYRAGWLRTRTTHFGVSMCIYVSADGRVEKNDPCDG